MKGTPSGASTALIARACATISRVVAALVAQLHERRPAVRHAAREVGQAVAARVFGIDKGIEAQINAHCA